MYSVYTLVINCCIRRVIETIFSGFDAAIGNMLARDEMKTLNRTMSIYELLSTQVSSVLFSCCVVLMPSFIKIYTLNVNDIDYDRPVFLIVLVFAELIYCLRLPYYSIITAKGLYRETRRGAIIEALLNIMVSLVLVFSLGLIGVAIGTFVAMSYRYLDMLLYTNRKIINRQFSTIIRYVLAGASVFVVAILMNKIVDFPDTVSFLPWLVYAFVFFVIISIFSIVIFMMFAFEDTKMVMGSLVRLFFKKNR